MDAAGTVFSDKLDHISDRTRDIQNGMARQRVMAQLDASTLLVRSVHDNLYAVPSYNLDVGVGLIRDGFIEPWTTEIISRLSRPGQVFVNVGANFGYYPVLAASRMERQGTVYALEANPHVFSCLFATLYWAGYPDIIRPHLCAAWHESGKQLELEFCPPFLGGGNVVSGAAASGWIMPSPAAAMAGAEALAAAARPDGSIDMARLPRCRAVVRTQALDDLLGHVAAVDLVQMDIEGAEPSAVLGARRLIQRSPNAILVLEVSPERSLRRKAGHDLAEMLSFLCGELGYSPYRVCTEGYRGLGSLPRLERLGPEALLQAAPHGDYLFSRGEPPASVLG